MITTIKQLSCLAARTEPNRYGIVGKFSASTLQIKSACVTRTSSGEAIAAACAVSQSLLCRCHVMQMAHVSILAMATGDAQAHFILSRSISVDIFQRDLSSSASCLGCAPRFSIEMPGLHMCTNFSHKLPIDRREI